MTGPRPCGPEAGRPDLDCPCPECRGKDANVGKTNVFFGPPLAILAEGQKNTLEISGKLNRTAERYLEILKHHGLELTEPERQCAWRTSATSASCRRWKSRAAF
jgi:hypothetical protein